MTTTGLGARAEMTTDQVLAGVGLLLALVVGCQILANQLRIPALIVLLPAGFAAGAVTRDVDPNHLLGAAYQPLVSLAVAVILYHAGLSLNLRKFTGSARSVIIRLVTIGVALTWAIAAYAGFLILDVSWQAAVMLGAILVVSGPTVVEPLLDFVRPTETLRQSLSWEGTMVDPLGGILGAVVFATLVAKVRIGHGAEAVQFGLSFGVGLAGGVAGGGLLWLLLHRLSLPDTLVASAQLASVIAIAAGCDIVREDAGLIAAIVMGLTVANYPGSLVSARQNPVGDTLNQLVLGLLFITISATVTPASLGDLILPVAGLVAVLVFVARPLVTALCTLGTTLSWRERAFVGWMAPRGIVAAATAATFSSTLVAKGISGAEKILPATFLTIVATVTLYGLTAVPVARLLGVASPSRTLLIGSDAWVLELARALRAAGAAVTMWAGHDEERQRIRAAGFELLPGELLDAATGLGAQIEGISSVLLLSRDDEFNVLATAMLRGSTSGPVFYLTPPAEDPSVTERRIPKEMLFDVELTAALRARQPDEVAQIAVRPANATPPPGARLLLLVRVDGELAPVTAGGRPARRRGDTAIHLNQDGVLAGPGTPAPGR